MLSPVVLLTLPQPLRTDSYEVTYSQALPAGLHNVVAQKLMKYCCSAAHSGDLTKGGEGKALQWAKFE